MRGESGGASAERGREHGSNLARLETVSEMTRNLCSRRLYELQAKMSGHAVCNAKKVYFCATSHDKIGRSLVSGKGGGGNNRRDYVIKYCSLNTKILVPFVFAKYRLSYH